MTLNGPQPGFQGHGILTSRISQKKRCVLRTKLLKYTYRKPYTIYGMVQFSMTLSDLWPRFQGHDIFWHWISQKKRAIAIDLGWPLNASSPLSASAELLVNKLSSMKNKEISKRSVRQPASGQNYRPPTNGTAFIKTMWCSYNPRLSGMITRLC